MGWSLSCGPDGIYRIYDESGRERLVVTPTHSRNYLHDAEECLAQTCVEEYQRRVEDLESYEVDAREYEERNGELQEEIDRLNNELTEAEKSVEEANENADRHATSADEACTERDKALAERDDAEQRISEVLVETGRRITELQKQVEDLNKLVLTDKRLLAPRTNATRTVAVSSLPANDTPLNITRTRVVPLSSGRKRSPKRDPEWWASNIGKYAKDYTTSINGDRVSERVGDRVLIVTPISSSAAAAVTGIVSRPCRGIAGDRSTGVMYRDDGASGGARESQIYRGAGQSLALATSGWYYGFIGERVIVLESPAKARLGEYVPGTYGEPERVPVDE